MKPWLVDLLRCPHCRPQQRLTLADVSEVRDGDVVEGFLVCAECGVRVPVTGGIPRFVGAGQDYCGNFGFQWQRWKETQIDGLAGHTLSATRFFKDSGWDRDWLKGKLILDCGCGAGRFTEVAARAGARVVSCDISAAVDACRDNAGTVGDVACVQASLFNLPLAEGAFDGLFCMGVIQHTPDPKLLIMTLPTMLRPGGSLVYNFYERDIWPRLQVIKYALRLVTPHLSTSANLRLASALVGLLFPLSAALSRIPKVRLLNHLLPIASVHHPDLSREQQYAWTLLDTFDWYTPRYERRQKFAEVMACLREIGLDAVEGRPGLVRARVRP